MTFLSNTEANAIADNMVARLIVRDFRETYPESNRFVPSNKKQSLIRVLTFVGSVGGKTEEIDFPIELVCPAINNWLSKRNPDYQVDYASASTSLSKLLGRSFEAKNFVEDTSLVGLDALVTELTEIVERLSLLISSFNGFVDTVLSPTWKCTIEFEAQVAMDMLLKGKSETVVLAESRVDLMMRQGVPQRVADYYLSVLRQLTA